MCESCLRPSPWDSAKPLPRSLPLTPCTGESDCPSKEEERYLYYYFPDIASHYRRTLEKKEKEKEQKDKSKKKVVKAQQQKKDTKEEEEKKRKKERSKNRKRKKDKNDTCNRETKAKGKNQDKDKKAAQNDSFSSSSLSSDKDETTDNDNDDNDDVDSNQKKMACAFHQCYICYHERWECSHDGALCIKCHEPVIADHRPCSPSVAKTHSEADAAVSGLTKAPAARVCETKCG